jgi:hypothetical protein
MRGSVSFAVIPLLLLGCSGGCGSSHATTPVAPADAGQDARHDATAEKDATPDHDASIALEADAPDGPVLDTNLDVYDPGPGPDGCGPFPAPWPVPPGWQEYTGWSCSCRLYVPGPSAKPVEPIQWEPCPAPLPQSGCRWMKTFWNDSGNASLGIFSRFSRDKQSGAPLLAFARIDVGGINYIRYHLVAEPDGAIRHALLAVDGGGCDVLHRAISDNRFGYSMLGDQWSGSAVYDATVEGFLGGVVGTAIPTAVKKLPLDPQGGSSWSVSDQWVIRESFDRIAYSWDFSESHVAYTPKDTGYAAGETTAIGKYIFVLVGGMASSGIVVWDPDHGMRPFLFWPGDGTRGAAAWGTDQKDMVWWQGEGKQPSDQVYPKKSVMIAPFTTDPAIAQATAKRVRSDIGGMTQKPYAVGCGYAVRTTVQPPPVNNALQVTRLSDGAAWILYGDAPAIIWDTALGVTCDEAFLEVAVHGDIRIVRLRLDSLGEPLPPD